MKQEMRKRIFQAVILSLLMQKIQRQRYRNLTHLWPTNRSLIVSMLGTVVGVSAEEFVDGTQLEEKIDTEENLENKIEDNIEEDGIEELVSDEIQEEDAEKAENIDSEIADLVENTERWIVL